MLLAYARRCALVAAVAVLSLAMVPSSGHLRSAVVAEKDATQDDAGSGGDAGKDLASAVRIELGSRYSGSLRPQTEGDGADWYVFEAVAGSVLRVELAAVLACAKIHGPDGQERGFICTEPVVGAPYVEVAAPVSGDYTLRVEYFAPDQDYTFAVASDASAGAGTEPMDPATQERAPRVVVAVADTGVNPYHEIYHRPGWDQHPCTWVAGFDDCSVPALRLSIGEYTDYADGVAADRAVWAAVQPGRWYWIPETNIIGAVCDEAENASGTVTNVAFEDRCILDENGHGTATTSSVLSEAPEALLLVHEGTAGATFLADAPVVPDVQSHSWGPAAPLPLHAADAVTPLSFAGEGSAFPETLFFLAAGNEAPFPAMLDYERVHPSVQVVGGGYPGYAESTSWSTYDFASWMCRPTAVHDSVQAIRPSRCGTSFAAPTVAGTAAAALLAIRRAERFVGGSTTDMVSATVSREEFVSALRRSASYAPEAKFPNPPSPTAVPLVPTQEHLLWGYGWLDSTLTDTVIDCALYARCPETSALAEAWNDARQRVRHATTGD